MKCRAMGNEREHQCQYAPRQSRYRKYPDYVCKAGRQIWLGCKEDQHQAQSRKTCPPPSWSALLISEEMEQRPQKQGKN